MNKLFLSCLMITLFSFSLIAQKQSIINDVLEQTVIDKVLKMQEIIGFNDNQAAKLKSAEFDYLINVRKAENCFLCSKKKRINKLKQARDKQLQEILERDEYIKYSAIENNLIKNIPVYLK